MLLTVSGLKSISKRFVIHPNSMTLQNHQCWLSNVSLCQCFYQGETTEQFGTAVSERQITLADLNELQKACGKTNFRCEVFPLCLLPPAGGRRADTNWSQWVNRYVGGEQRWRPHWRQVVWLEESAQSRWLVWGLSACGSLHSHHSRWPLYTVYQHSSDRASNPQSQSGSKIRDYWRISCLKAAHRRSQTPAGTEN